MPTWTGTPGLASLAIDGPFTVTHGTITTDIQTLDVSVTWDNAAVTFGAIRLRVTDTASAAASTLLDIGTVASGTRFAVRKDGQITPYGHYIPTTNMAYDIGSSGFRVRDYYGKQLNTHGGTRTAVANDYYSTVIWNNAAVTFTHAVMNVVDTASAASSIVQDWQVDGVSRMRLRKDGSLEIRGPRPFTDVRAHGAVGDNTTDDLPAFTAAIALVAAAGGGDIYVPPGSYFVNGTITLNSPHLHLYGTGNGTGIRGNGTADIINITSAGTRCIVSDMFINTTAGTIRTAGNGITMGAVVEAEVSHVTIAQTFNGIALNSSVDCRLDNIKIYSCYGPAMINLSSAGAPYLSRLKLDNPYPGINPTALTAWVASTVYSAGALVNGIDGNATILQCITGGTSGASAPAIAAYGTNITDGTVTWRLACTNSHVGLLVGGASSPVFVQYADISGATLYGMHISGTAQGVFAHMLTLDFVASQSIRVTGGTDVILDSIRASNVVEASGGSNVYIGPAVTGQIRLANSWMSAARWGVVVESGPTDVSLVNNHIGANAVASVVIKANATKFSIIGNRFPKDFPQKTGAQTTGILIEAGTSNDYFVLGNWARDNATPISDGGTGSNKLVVDNAGIFLPTAGTAGAPVVVLGSDSNTGLFWQAADVLGVAIGGNEGLRIAEPADGNVALSVRRNVGGTLSLQQMSMGAIDSGGAGFKVLRIPN